MNISDDEREFSIRLMICCIFKSESESLLIGSDSVSGVKLDGSHFCFKRHNTNMECPLDGLLFDANLFAGDAREFFTIEYTNGFVFVNKLAVVAYLKHFRQHIRKMNGLMFIKNDYLPSNENCLFVLKRKNDGIRLTKGGSMVK